MRSAAFATFDDDCCNPWIAYPVPAIILKDYHDFINANLNLSGILYVMRILIAILVLMMATPAMAQNTDESPRLWDRIITGQWLPSQWTFFNATKEWKSSHWRGQGFQSSIQPEKAVQSASLNLNRSMFAGEGAISPNHFIENLRQANIIGRIYNPEYGFIWDKKASPDVIIEVGQNFYTLSYADQAVITNMLARAFPNDSYVLKDKHTHKVVGQLTADGFNLY